MDCEEKYIVSFFFFFFLLAFLILFFKLCSCFVFVFDFLKWLLVQYGYFFLKGKYRIEEEHSGPTPMNNSVIKTNYNFRSLCTNKTKNTESYYQGVLGWLVIQAAYSIVCCRTT